jgi:hypothetical protein
VKYEDSVWCEVRIGANWPHCDPYPSIMQKHFGNLNSYLKAPEQLTPLGSTAAQDATLLWQRVVCSSAGPWITRA